MTSLDGARRWVIKSPVRPRETRRETWRGMEGERGPQAAVLAIHQITARSPRASPRSCNAGGIMRSGLIALLEHVKPAGGRIVLANCHSNVELLFRMTHLDTLISLVDSVDRALEACCAAAAPAAPAVKP